MTNWKLLSRLVFGRPAHPYVSNLRDGEDRLFTDGLPMGTLILGKQGSGKTSALVNHLIEYMEENPSSPIFIIDWSGSLTNKLLEVVSMMNWEQRERFLRRIIYDELGHPDLVVPMPEFSHLYGSSTEEQIERVKNSWIELTRYLTDNASILGGVAFRGLAPALFTVLTALGWQITEFGDFVDSPKPLLPDAFKAEGVFVPEKVRELLTRRMVNVKGHEQELRTYSFTEMRAIIESPVAMARLGYFRPGWTPREAIRNGKLVIVNASRLINQEAVQHYLVAQIYSLIMEEINKRQPDNPEDPPISIVMDETYTVLRIAGFADRVGMMPSLYRSRKVQPYVVIQALWQLDEDLRDQIWSFGNVIAFAVENNSEAEIVAKQLPLKYDPTMVKQEARTDYQNPTTESTHGQYKLHADWIQTMPNRACLVRRYYSQAEKDNYIRYVRKTKDLPIGNPSEPLSALKERLLRQRAVSVVEVMKLVNGRTLKNRKTVRPSF